MDGAHRMLGSWRLEDWEVGESRLDVADGMSCMAGMGEEVCVDGAGRMDDCNRAVMRVRACVDGGNSMGAVASVGVEARVNCGNRVSNKLWEVSVDGANVMSGEAVVGVETLWGRGDSGHQGEQGDGLGEEAGRHFCLNINGCFLQIQLYFSFDTDISFD